MLSLPMNCSLPADLRGNDQHGLTSLAGHCMFVGLWKMGRHCRCCSRVMPLSPRLAVTRLGDLRGSVAVLVQVRMGL